MSLVLVVDDEPSDCRLLEVMLAADGFETMSAASGEEALSTIGRRPPDLVILDILMPGLDGYEVTRKLKAGSATRNIPIIVVTALHDREAKMHGLDAGAEEFLSKPVDRAELTVRVRNLLRLKAYGDYHDKYSQLLEGEVSLRTVDLVESERLYRATFDAAPVGIVHVGLDRRWLRVNQRLCTLLGYSADELRGARARDLLQSPDAPGDADAFAQLAAGTLDRYVVDEKPYRRRNGTIMWAKVYLSVHRDTAGRSQHYVIVIEDITAQRALEAQVRQSTKMDAIGQLAAGVAHDFNNLLSVILSFSELMMMDLKPNDPMCADLGEIKGAGLRAVALTHQLLAFSRQQVLKPQIVNLAEIVSGMAQMLKRLIGEDIELTTNAEVCGKTLLDPGQVEQLIMNLAVNARDAMPQGGKLTIETGERMLDKAYASEHTGVTPGPHAMLAVTDTGVGMDKTTQTRMFEPFFTTKEAGKGTGLGLATVFGIVRQSGGTIWVYSEPGKGTTFKLFFPVAVGAGALESPSPPVEIRSLRGTETILIVEDDERVRLTACTILRRYGYNVLDAQSGGDAFLLCEQHTATIHLLLTDVVMPRMSGRQLAERLQILRPKMRLLYMSGYTNDQVVRHGILDSTIAFIEKPITPDALVRKVRQTLDAVA